MRKYLLMIIAVGIVSLNSFAQDLLGLSTGNYAGVAGMSLNPASIVDSRLKFELNLLGLSNYYSNNYLSVKRDALIKGSFFKDKYKDWSLVQRDLLEENRLAAGERVHLRLNNRVIAPLSFMLTTGKKSAVAFTIANRTGLTVNNLDQSFARLAYNRFEDASLYNNTMDMSGVNMDVLNWLDVGLTYGRVLLNKDKHFLKAAVTFKYIGGVASGYFQSDDLMLAFRDKNTIDASTAYARYGHGEKLGFDMFKSASLKSLRPEAEGFGWNAGVVYEYRGKIDKFKYLNPESEETTRRDKNKYAFKAGVSVMDAGKFTFRKSNLNNDFSANISNWNLKQYNIRNIKDVDTMLASRVMYAATGDNEYTVALPTAYSVQVDFHLGKGFYLNAMTYQPFKLLDADRRMNVEPAYAVTPRFESRVFGFYLPVSYNKFDDWNVGATFRAGPVYFGSGNLASLVFNDKTRTADLHAGLRIPITYGSPSRLAKTFDAVTKSKDKDVYIPAVSKKDSLKHLSAVADQTKDRPATDSVLIKKELEIKSLEARLFELEKQRVLDSIRLAASHQPAAPAVPVTITINNYTGSGTSSVRFDTVKPANAVPAKITAMKPDTVKVKQSLPSQQPQLDTLIKRLAEREMQLKKLKQQLNKADSSGMDDAKPVKEKRTSQVDSKEEKEPLAAIEKRVTNDINKKEAAATQPLAYSPTNNLTRNDIKKLEDEIDDLRKAILTYETVSAAAVTGSNALVTGAQTAKLQKEIAGMRSDMANYQPMEVADSNHALQQEIVRLKEELAAKQQPVTIDTVYALRALEAEIGQLRKDIEAYRAQDKPVVKTPVHIITQTEAPATGKPVAESLLAMQLEKILFDVNKAVIRPVYYNTLNFVAQNLNDYPGLKLQIEGYTDKSGSPQLNKRLSLLRADAVKKYLVRRHVNPSQLLVSNYGEEMPAADNSTGFGKLLNRRVELKFVQE